MSAQRPLRILVVDDDDAVRALLLRALQGEGYDLVAVNDGLAGLDAAWTIAPNPNRRQDSPTTCPICPSRSAGTPSSTGCGGSLPAA